MSVELSNVKAKYISEKSPLKQADKDEGEVLSDSQQGLFQSKLDFIRSISSEDNSREGSGSQDRNTNEVGSNDTEVQDQTMAAFTGLEANIAQKPLIINNATIASLGEMYPHNDGVSDLQASLTETINSGRKIEDMPEEIKDQLKLIFNPK
ncbi:MAG: hypothetical protein VKK32_03180 [Candidatus Melainabacteria bacterium]|nr:hypothetical protein [Candidatus Melainabacteria bacterium]